jgi:DNA-binding transcriptional ArsR family regulator
MMAGLLAPAGRWWAATVIGVVITDARAVIDALADPETLYVFGVVAARTSKLGLPAKERAGTTPYVTPFGLMRETSLSRDAVEAAAERLKRAGLLESLVDDERGYENWRVSEAALAWIFHGYGRGGLRLTGPRF